MNVLKQSVVVRGKKHTRTCFPRHDGSHGVIYTVTDLNGHSRVLPPHKSRKIIAEIESAIARTS